MRPSSPNFASWPNEGAICSNTASAYDRFLTCRFLLFKNSASRIAFVVFHHPIRTGTDRLETCPTCAPVAQTEHQHCHWLLLGPFFILRLYGLALRNSRASRISGRVAR